MPGSRGTWGFMARWVFAVAAALVLAGAGEYLLASHQMQDRVLAASAADYGLHAAKMEKVLAQPESFSRDIQVLRELASITQLVQGTEYVALLRADGSRVSQHGGPHVGVPSATDVAEVARTGEATWGVDANVGDGEQNRFEFLVPVASTQGTFVLEIDQRADVVEALVDDTLERQVIGVLLGVLLAVPLSYLLGGRTLQRQHANAREAAQTDALTGLMTRRPFWPLLTDLVTGSRSPVALAVVDVDEFKQVNDRLGHSYGDRVLVGIAEAFGVLRSSDTAFRIGGDEFAVVLRGTGEREAEEAVERVRREVTRRVPGVTISCGVAVAEPGADVPAQELWERADAALFEAKRLGRRRTATFSAVSAALTVAPGKLAGLSALLEGGEGLDAVFQPIWDLRSGAVIGHEALLRLPGPSTVDGPAEAFALAERVGRAVELDELARVAVLRAVAARRWTGRLFVKIHPEALSRLDLDTWEADVRAAGLEVADVTLEVTEHPGLDAPERLQVLRDASARGFQLALGGMGRGNSGLRALTHLRFDVVKIDRGVIARLGTDPASDAVVAAATAFIGRSGGCVVAEGIEEPAMLTSLLRFTDTRPGPGTVLAAQGYLLGRPGHDLVVDGSLSDLVGGRLPLPAPRTG